MDRVRGANVDADVESLWQEFRDGLRAFIRSRVRDEAAAADVLQVAFLRMHQAFRAGTRPEQPHAWVFAITRNAIADHYRTEGGQAQRVAGAAAEPAAEPVAPWAAGEADVVAELARCVQPLLRGLEAPYREALELTALEGMTQGAAAKKVGVSLSGMKSRVQRGRTQLLDVFEQCCAIEVDARGRPIEMSPRTGCACGPQE
jgi:RNA polymerase sigma-70 factor (ECF subfamily)